MLGDKNNESLMSAREKYWEEKDDKQKIAKLGTVLALEWLKSAGTRFKTPCVSIGME